jgi:hypothetical protein
MKNPNWWNEKHEGTWDRIKSAMKRDWEQTKADVSSKGHELDQSVGDTVKQMAGKEAIPPGNMPNPPGTDKKWEDIEPTYRYGVGARTQYGSEWDEKLESKLSNEWTEIDEDREWDDVKGSVRRGYDYGKK